MKGLLQRLAARAAGTAAMLRPDLQGPVPAAPAPGDVVSVHNEASAIISDNEPETARPASPRPSANPATGPAPLHAALRGDTAALPPQPLRPDPRRPPDEPPARATRPQATADNPVRGAPLRDSDRPPPIDQARAVTPPALPSPLAPPQLARARQATAARFDQPAPSAAAEGDAQPWPSAPLLMPGKQPAAHPTLQRPTRWTTQPTTQLVAPAHPAAARTGAAASASTVSAGEAAEVHIHIGRIDVTAVREAPPAARRRPAAAPAAPSLDDYLAQRRRG